MTRRAIRLMAVLVIGIALGALGTRALDAQPTGITRAMLIKTDLTGVEGKEVLMGTAELAPGVAAGRHFHHGIEVGYVLEGTALLEVEGQPPRTLKVGDSYQVPATTPHDARNTGGGAAKVLAVWVVDKGKPLAVAAPR
jgi:quercetin dioxygenase-like cupin family protein